MSVFSRGLVQWFLLAPLALALAGCATTPKTLVLTKDIPASIEVDLIGVTPSDKSYWLNSVKPNDYWKPGSSARKNAQRQGVSTKFESGREYRLEPTHKIWQQWRAAGATELLVFADLHGRELSNDAHDPRRLFLPLGSKAYLTKDKIIQVRIDDDRPVCETPFRIKKK